MQCAWSHGGNDDNGDEKTASHFDRFSPHWSNINRKPQIMMYVQYKKGFKLRCKGSNSEKPSPGCIPEWWGSRRCRAGQKSARKCRRSKTPPWRRKGQGDTLLPKRLGTTQGQVNKKGNSFMMKRTYCCRCIICRSPLSEARLGSSRRTGMEIFYLSRCCRRRANAKQPLLVLRRQAPPNKDFPVVVAPFGTS